MRKAFEQGINQEEIAAGLNKFTAETNGEKTKNSAKESERIIDELVDRYETVFGHVTNRGGSKEAQERELDYAFIRAFTELSEKADREQWGPVERRILQSDLLSLHYLFVGGGIETAYEKYITKIDDNRSEIDIQADLAEQFIQKQHERNKESELLRRFPDAPTTGFEFEYMDTLSALVGYREELEKAVQEILAEVAKVGVDNISFGVIDKPHRIVEKLDKELSDYTGRVLTDAQMASILKAISKLKSQELDLPQLVKLIKDTPTRNQRLAEWNAYKDVPEVHDAREFVSTPAASPRMLLKDFIYAKRLGCLEGNVTMHQTIAGIELTPGKSDFMEVRAIAEGAAFLDPEWYDPERAQGLDSIVSETYRKPSLINGEEYYFPFHRSRSANSKQDTYTAYPRGKEKRGGIEERSFVLVTDQNFPGLVRNATFTWLSSWSYQAAEKEPNQRTAEEGKLAEAWTDLQKDWSEMLIRYKIDQPTEEERWVKVTDELKMVPGQTGIMLSREVDDKVEGFLTYMATLRILGHTEKAFRSECRRLITKHNQKVKEIIGY